MLEPTPSHQGQLAWRLGRLLGAANMTLVGVGLSFFFQAEDGIRDSSVTGVQTCALPIFDQSRNLPANHANQTNSGKSILNTSGAPFASIRVISGQFYFCSLVAALCGSTSQIGRASCRERV